MGKITSYTALTSPQPDDVLVIVDVHDQTMAPTGTDKQITVANLVPPATSGAAGGVQLAGDLGGTAASPQVTGTHLGTPLPLAQGGTGQATQQAALDALAGAVTSGQFLRGNGTHVALGAIQAGDVPTLNQSTTGNAATATNLAGAAAFPAEVSPKVTQLTDAATIAVNAALGNDFYVTLGGNRTVGAPTNPTDGQTIRFEVIQDGTGSRTLTWASGAGGYAFGSGTAPTLSTAAGATDLAAFRYSSRKNAWLYLGTTGGF